MLTFLQTETSYVQLTKPVLLTAGQVLFSQSYDVRYKFDSPAIAIVGIMAYT